MGKQFNNLHLIFSGDLELIVGDQIQPKLLIDHRQWLLEVVHVAHFQYPIKTFQPMFIFSEFCINNLCRLC